MARDFRNYTSCVCVYVVYVCCRCVWFGQSGVCCRCVWYVVWSVCVWCISTYVCAFLTVVIQCYLISYPWSPDPRTPRPPGAPLPPSPDPQTPRPAGAPWPPSGPQTPWPPTPSDPLEPPSGPLDPSPPQSSVSVRLCGSSNACGIAKRSFCHKKFDIFCENRKVRSNKSNGWSVLNYSATRQQFTWMMCL